MAAEIDRMAVAMLVGTLAQWWPDMPRAVLTAWATAIAQATPHALTILTDPACEGHGAVTIGFARGWPSGVTPAPHYLAPPRPKRVTDLD